MMSYFSRFSDPEKDESQDKADLAHVNQVILLPFLLRGAVSKLV